MFNASISAKIIPVGHWHVARRKPFWQAGPPQAPSDFDLDVAHRVFWPESMKAGMSGRFWNYQDSRCAKEFAEQAMDSDETMNSLFQVKNVAV